MPPQPRIVPVGESHLVELVKLDPTLRLDIRYARSDNILGRPVYGQARAFLQAPVAADLIGVQRDLSGDGLGLLIFDGYRPWSVTALFWEATPPAQRMFVADPAFGSRHNRGCAVDLALCCLETGRRIPMPSEFDEFTERAFANYGSGGCQETRMRDLLISAMGARGFQVNPLEWWHYDHRLWESYPVYDGPFENIPPSVAPEGWMHTMPEAEATRLRGRQP